MKRSPILICGCIFTLAVLAGCTNNRRYEPVPPPPSVQNTPLFIGAQNVFTRTDPDKVTTYYTVAAEQEAILSFYRDILLEEQWELKDAKRPEAIYASWSDGCIMYRFWAEVAPKDERQTYVKLDQDLLRCID